MDRLTQEQFDYYYSQTDPREPKPVREVHAIRMALSKLRNQAGAPRAVIRDMVKDFIEKYRISSIKYAGS